MANGDDDSNQPLFPKAPKPIDETPTKEKPIEYAGTNNPVPADEQAPRATLVNPGPNAADEHNLFLKMQVEQLNQDKKDEQDLQTSLGQIHSELKDIAGRIQQPIPETPQYTPYPSLPGSADQKSQQDRKTNFGMIAHDILSMVAIGSVVFGHRAKGGWGNAIMNYGLGEFLKGYAHSSEEVRKDQLTNWQKGIELISKDNQEKTQDYRNVMSDRRLDLEQQSMLIRDLAQQRQDWKLAQAAQARDINAILKNIDSKERANLAFRRMNLDAFERIRKAVLSDKVEKQWSVEVMSRTGKNPLASKEAFMEAQEKFPISKMLDAQKGWGKETSTFDSKTGKYTTSTRTFEDIYKKDKLTREDLLKNSGIDPEDLKNAGQ